MLLTYDELLLIMSDIKAIPKYLVKCLPSIDNIGLF
jgi:hypothetical protein